MVVQKCQISVMYCFVVTFTDFQYLHILYLFKKIKSDNLIVIIMNRNGMFFSRDKIRTCETLFLYLLG